MRARGILLTIAIAALILPAAAQTASTTNKATINQRKDNQQDRIGNGIQSGQLTPGEAARLEKKESELNQKERDMRKLDNGHLTKTDRAALRQQQNQLSRQIYRHKHDAQVDNTNPHTEVGQRERNQQERIAQGVKSGQLTAGEASRLEGREAHINREIRRDRAENGGTLTPAERRRINRQENRTSRAIYRQKHDAQHPVRIISVW
jgi:hypothetical protein